MRNGRPKVVWNTRTIVILGLMMAITIILTRYLSIQVGGWFRLSLGNVAA